MSVAAGRDCCVLGIDVGGTKCAGGIVALPLGRAVCRKSIPTGADRAGQVVLDDVLSLIDDLREAGRRLGREPTGIGLAVAELVSLRGEVLSGATIRWEGQDVGPRIAAETGLPVRLDADVRAASRAEAVLGAGRGLGSFLYATIGTGISAALVIDGRPYPGCRGLTGTFASAPCLIADEREALALGLPLEQYAAGPALARRFATRLPGFAGSAEDVVRFAESGDPDAQAVIESAGKAVGAALAQLVNMLDPEIVVLGGGLGMVEGLYRQAINAALRAHIWSALHRDLPLVSSALGVDAGWIGAALGAEMLAETRRGHS